MDFAGRRLKLVELLAESGLHALVLMGRENLRYFSGFTGTDGILLCTPEKLFFLTDSRYTSQAKTQVTADTVVEYKVKVDAVIEILREFGAEQIAFEANLSYHTVLELQKAGEECWQWRPLKEELESLRMVKDPAEIVAIERAATLNREVFDDLCGMIRPGVREHEIAIELEYRLKRLGAEEKSFDFIVASGERGALPHGVASDRRLCGNELVTIDFGCRIAGYHSDETVTLAIGEVAPEQRKIYDTVLEAHDQAIAAVKPGVPLIEVDRVARDLITQAGYGDYFGHGLGHGVGLNVHEAPVVSPRAKQKAEPGMVFTVEPGIYIPGMGGVRIEDMVLVTDSGCRTLTSIPKTFRNILVN